MSALPFSMCDAYHHFYMSRYSGLVDKKTGNVVLDAIVASEVTAAFEWSWVFASDAYVETVTCRVDNVKTRGVPVPDKLRGHVGVYDLKHAAASAAATLDMEMKGRLDHITCEYSSTLHVACVPTCMVQWLIMMRVAEQH